MINQDEVFVITEDDILKPSDKKGKGSGSRGSGPIAFARPGKGADAADVTLGERTGSGSRRRSRRHGGAAGAAAAGSLSLFVWGLGQLYNGERRLATLFFLCQMQILAFHYLLFMTWDQIRKFSNTFFVSEWELVLYASSIDFCLIFLMLYNVVQAYRSAESQGTTFTGLHRPLVAGLASTIVPGWGQILNGQIGKAMIFLFAFLLQAYVLVLSLASPFYRVVVDLDPQQLLLKKAIWLGMGIVFATALSWLLGVYDAVVVARYNRRLN